MQNYIDHHTWLVNSHLFTDEIKDNVAMGGYCLLEDVKDVCTNIDFNTKTVTYSLSLSAELYNNMMLLRKFENNEKLGFFESLRLKKFLKNKKEVDETGMGYRLEDIGNLFIKKYLNNEWGVKVNLFKEGSPEKDVFWSHNGGNQSLD